MSLIPVASAQRDLNLKASDMPSDTLQGKLNTAEAIVARMSNRTLTATVGKAFVHSPPCATRTLYLSDPIQDEATLVVEKRLSPTDAWEAIAASDFEATTPDRMGKHIALYRLEGGEWPAGDRVLRTTYDVGYADEDALPPELRDLILEVTGWLVATHKPARAASFSSEATGETPAPRSMPRDLRTRIRSYNLSVGF